MIITIDGPVASGKSSVAKRLAQKLGFYYLNTGLLYRAISYVLSNRGITADSAQSLTTENLFFVSDLVYRYEHDTPSVIYQGENITQCLYADSIGQLASIFSAQKVVRDALLALQRSVGKQHDVVVDGRDCGSVVFPHATVKFFLTADVDIRAQRLFNDATRKRGQTLEEAKAHIRERDLRDQTRAVAPLVIPHDAILVDNTDMDLEQTVNFFLKHVPILP